jgi:NADPH-dependent curcumin reductase CurA
LGQRGNIQRYDHACGDGTAGRLTTAPGAAYLKGVTAFFDNIGGDMHHAMLARMTVFGRITARGRICDYSTAAVPKPRNVRSLLAQRQRMHAFIGADWAERRRPVARLGAWHKEARHKICKGSLDTFPASLRSLFTGGNFGKLVGKL